MSKQSEYGDCVQLYWSDGRLVLMQSQPVAQDSGKLGVRCYVIDPKTGDFLYECEMEPQNVAATLDAPAAGDPSPAPAPAPANPQPQPVVIRQIPKPQSAETELHVVGQYEGVQRGLNAAPTEVHVKKTDAPIILYLCSYEECRWAVKLDEGVKLESIILGGYKIQVVSNPPPNVPVVDCTRPVAGSKALPYAYMKPGERKGSSVTAYQSAQDNRKYLSLQMSLKAAVGREIKSFQGQYRHDGKPVVVE